MTRLAPLDLAALSDAQKRVYEAIKSGPRGAVGGPFPALLRAPEIADKIQGLGACLRFEGRLAAPLREVAILVAARHWRCAVEWNAHVIIAEREGVGRGLIKAIADGATPKDASREERMVLAICRQLNEDQFVAEATYRQAVEAIGLDQVVELIVILGYYTLLAMVLNGFEVLPDGNDGAVPAALQLRD